MPQSCGSCAKTSDFALCWDCLGTLRDTLAGLQQMVGELQTQVTRQDKGAPSAGISTQYEWTIPFNVKASSVASELHSILAKWSGPRIYTFDELLFRVVFVDQQPVAFSGLELDAILKTSYGRIHKESENMLARLLHDYVRLGRLDTGPQMLRDFQEILSLSKRVVDRREPQIWLGECEHCERTLRALPSELTLQCPCGAVYVVSELRQALRSLGEEQIVSARDATALGEVFGSFIKEPTIRVWRHRGKLDCLRAECTPGCSHLYRFGDILTLHKLGLPLVYSGSTRVD